MYQCCSALEVSCWLWELACNGRMARGDYLHYERAAICSALGNDDIFGILLGGNVDLAITFRHSNLCETSRGERKGGESSE